MVGRLLLLLFGLGMVAPGVTECADIELISQGRRVDIEAHLVQNKLVLFDFYADWCAPCRIIEPQIDRLAELHSGTLAVRKVDVIDWNSPVARQYGVEVLPYLMLYGPHGELLADGDVEQVFRALESRLGDNALITDLGDRRGSPLLFIAVAVAVTVGVVWARRRRPSSQVRS